MFCSPKHSWIQTDFWTSRWRRLWPELECILAPASGVPASPFLKNKDLSILTYAMVTSRFNYVGLPLE